MFFKKAMLLFKLISAVNHSLVIKGHLGFICRLLNRYESNQETKNHCTENLNHYRDQFNDLVIN